MQDKWSALIHGRPSHIFSSNWAVLPLTPGDFPDVEWDKDDAEERIEIERGRTLFVQMVLLSQVLAEILETFYTLQATQAVTNAGPQGTQLVLSLTKPIQLKLKEWHSGLPASIRMDSTFQSSSAPLTRFSSIGYLHLAYFAAEITLHSRIIRSIDLAAGAGGVDVDPYIQHICRIAAKARLISAMDFVNRLTPSFLHAFWYFASKANFALIVTFASLLWATSSGRDETDWYRRRLGEYWWTLSVLSKPGEGKGLTEFAMSMLDITTGLLKQLPEKPLLSRSGSAVDIDAAKRQSIPMFGVGGGSTGTGTMSSVPIMSALSGLMSGEVSRVASPRSPTSESTDEGMYGNFSATAGGAGLGD